MPNLDRRPYLLIMIKRTTSSTQAKAASPTAMDTWEGNAWDSYFVAGARRELRHPQEPLDQGWGTSSPRAQDHMAWPCQGIRGGFIQCSTTRSRLVFKLIMCMARE